MSGLDHKNIVKIIEYGSDGKVVKASGRIKDNLVYVVLEYFNGKTLFEMCNGFGKMKEEVGRLFLTQMIDVLSYMNEKGAVHRNLKLENIYVDNQLNIKLFDFGYATFTDVKRLSCVRGTLPYMAPEIIERKTYDGTKADIFSTGVILFIMMQGIFPFNSA